MSNYQLDFTLISGHCDDMIKADTAPKEPGLQQP